MTSSHEISKLLIEVIPVTMQRIRLELRSAMSDALTVPQFRILASIFHGNRQASEIAKLHGVSQAAMSKMVEGLVERGLIRRATGLRDRRQVDLKLTRKGEVFFKKTRKQAQAKLREKISSMPAKERQDLAQGLSVLAALFQRRRA